MPPALLSQRLFCSSALLLTLAVSALAVDLPIARLFLCEVGPTGNGLRDLIHELVRPAEAFANGLGVLLLLLVLYAADEAHRRGLVRFAVIVFGAGVAANIGKGLVARARPRVFFDADTGQFAGGVLASFQGWLPLTSLGYSGQSVPSGHAATAVALAIVLSRRWPHAWGAFASLALLAVLQRISFNHHYLSDCLAGAALATFIAAVVYHPRLAGRWFDRLEGSPGSLECVTPALSPENRRAA